MHSTFKYHNVHLNEEKKHFIGYEITKEYFDIAQERIKQEQSKLTLF